MVYALPQLYGIAIGFVVLLGLDLTAQILRFPRFAGTMPSAVELLTNGSQGKEFYVCLPLNDNQIQPTTAREIYVTSSRNTVGTFEIPGLGVKKVFNVQAMRVTILKPPEYPLPEIEESETASNRVIRIRARDPISVYVYNGKQVSSDGYLAIPVQSWGKEYVHLGWPDFREFRNWKGGFGIISAYDNTQVTIQLRKSGVGDYGITSARTEKGRQYGSVWTVTLNAGEAYLVQGDGTTRCEFDLSGSFIKASKPIGFLCYHQRNMVPCLAVNNGRDHMIEMVPPISMVGRQYVTVELERGGQGDFYRVVPIYDGTHIECQTFDFTTKALLDKFFLSGLRRGEVRSIPDAGLVVTGPGQATGVRGMSVWRSNKPFFLMHYSPSAEWDNANLFDPFMIYVVPVEQYTKATIFQSPDNPAYSRHRLNLIIAADVNDPTQADLRSIKIDGQYLTALVPSVLGNRIPGTNLHYARLFVTNGPHVIEGSAPFGGYVYGWGSFDSYGWPAATAYRKLDEFDTIPPPLSRIEECGDFLYTARETNQDFPINDTLHHIGTGVIAIDFVEGKPSYNYAIEILESDGVPIEQNTLPNDSKNAVVKFRLRVIDKSKNAQAYFYVSDRALNISYDSVRWTAPKLSIIPNPIEFGNRRVGRTATLTVALTNTTDTVYVIKTLRLLRGSVFRIVEPSIPTGGLTVLPRQTIQVTLIYTPQTEHVRDNERDEDSLLVEEQCAPFSVLVTGRGVQPHIVVDDWDAGTIPIGSTRCHTQQFGRGLRITNPGTDTLTISNIDRSIIQPPFSLSDPTNPELPIVIPPKGIVYLQELCFTPTREDTFSIIVRFTSDAPNTGGDKPWSWWRGNSTQPGPVVIGNNWGRVRIGTTRVLNGIIRNLGSESVQCTDVYLSPNDPHFHIIGQDRNPPFTVFPNGQDEVKVRIICSPQAEFELGSRLYGDFSGVGTRSDTLTAYGYLEKIQATDAIFRQPVLVGTTVTSQPGVDEQFVTFTNVSRSAELRIYSVNLLPISDPAQNLYPGDFVLLDTPTDISLPIGSAPEQLRVQFTPSGIGQRSALVRILHNAEPPIANPTGTAETIVRITGFGYAPYEPTIDGYDYGYVVTCSEPVGSVLITNTAPPGTPSAVVDVVEAILTGPDAQYFSLLNPPTSNSPLSIPAGEQRTIGVRFSPNEQRGYKAYVRVVYNSGKIDSAEIRGVGFIIPLEIRTEFSTRLFNFQRGSNVDLDLKVICRDWANASLSSFDLRLRYNGKQLVYVPNSIQRGLILGNTWQLNAAEQIIDPQTGEVELRIHGTGPTPLAADGILARVRFTVLVSDMPHQRFAPVNISQFLGHDASGTVRNKCLDLTLLPDSILPTTCFFDGRFVKISLTPFSMIDISPHPVTGDFVTVRFGVGFDAPTRIIVTDAIGSNIRTIVDGHLPVGIYELEIPLHTMSSGLYFVRFESGPMRSIQRMLVIR